MDSLANTPGQAQEAAVLLSADELAAFEQGMDRGIRSGDAIDLGVLRLLASHRLQGRLLAQALAALVRTEWGRYDEPPFCANCAAARTLTHEPDCIVGNAIAALRAAGVGTEG